MIERSSDDALGFRLSTQRWLDVPRPRVFDFFADAWQLEAITPPWLHFHVLTPRPIEMRAGALIDYRLRLHGLPVKWRTEISDWTPPHRFVDRQLSGPYQYWIHEHTFEEHDGGTLVRDVVRYRLPFSRTLGRLAHSAFVQRDLEKIFRYRQEQMRKLLKREIDG